VVQKDRFADDDDDDDGGGGGGGDIPVQVYLT
jgi:hypothetical protein